MNNELYQAQYFKFMHINYPTLMYNDILLILSEKYNPNKIYYSLKKFNNFKNNYTQAKQNNIKNENYLDKVEVKGKKLLISSHKYIDKDEVEHSIKIFGTKKSLENLSNNYFSQYFLDSTYKCIPNNLGYKALLLIIGYNTSNDNFELCSAILLTHEDNETLSELYYYLKLIWKFNPLRITYDFAQGNIKAINNVFQDKDNNIVIIPCLFHLVQAWWKKMSKLGFRKKEYKKKTQLLMLNLKLLPFMTYKNAKDFYDKIKDSYNTDYSTFFDYFEQTWLDPEEENKSIYPFRLWKYEGKINLNTNRSELISQKSLEDYIFLSNNACESLNHLINSLIAINQNVSITRFEIILKTLFIRMEAIDNQNQDLQQIERKRQFSDLLMDLIKLGYGKKKGLVKENEFKLIKKFKEEKYIFKLTFSNNN